ncbi:receptor-like protein kinase FERONIA [Cryptomeria japonica]|uniref:receptor-like protein kinase FERONIA n=1 Tax=Cryptomeria japonica TaxID=3369 RepID=UPI0027D9F350|nr:receptor-like protein kinase FERONIA [Cryptomeria japonica]
MFLLSKMRRSTVRGLSGTGWGMIALFLGVLSLGAAQNNTNSSFIPKVAILMNCGSQGSKSDAMGRSWVGDEESKYAPPTVANLVSAAASSQDPSLPSPVPYMTARIFTAPATYSFVVSPGRYWLRLHFYPSDYTQSYPRSDAIFTVASNGYTLLHNFSTSQTADALTQAYLIREFSVNVSNDHLNVTFSQDRKSGYAFVNGIEVVSMPDLFNSAPLVGADAQFSISSSTVLQTMYRLNVGGQAIQPIKDSNLSRTWYDDTPYIYGAAYGITGDNGTNDLVYGSIPQYMAPVDVYTTYRSMTPDPTVNSNFNLTWMFYVDANFTYLARLHFCEWIYTLPNQRAFNIYINNQTAETAFDVIGTGANLGNPIYKDYAIYVPAQEGDPYLFVALQPDVAVKPQYYDAILNGLELFKLNDSAGNLAGPNPVASIVDNSQGPDSGVNASPSSHSSSSKGPVIGGVAGGVAVLGLILALFCFIHRRRGRSSDGDKPSGWLPLPLYGGNSHTMGSKVSTASGKSGTGSYVSSAPSSFCRHFTFAEIQEATKNFDESRILGVGGFGKVYEGEVDGGTKVAVKRGNPLAEQGIHEFQTEIEMLSKLRHRHLVSLIGYCEENCEMILVYDYMAKGPLRGHIYGNSNLIPLSWKQRLEICIGAARGLHYLHTGAAQTIIHRDVKTTNILLDENLVAKVSDFGLSKTGPTLDHTHVSTVVKGSFGYLDPEYYRRQQLTEKSDVYSFGVVLFEVLCARPAINPSLPREQVSIAEWALHYQRKGMLEQIIDPLLKGKINPESLKKYGEAAEKCLAEQGVDRPAMGDVLWNLEFALQLQETAMENKLVDDSTTDLIQMSPDYSHVNNSATYAVGDNSTSTSTAGHSLASVDLDDVTPSAVFSQLVNPQGR